MLDDLLLHPRTYTQLRQFVARTSHGLILTGEKGLGKQSLARAVASALLGLDNEEKLNNYPYLTVINPSELVITIDEIRKVQKLLKLKTPTKSNSAIRRVIIIIQAERMRSEAQNAFLKSLEEPPEDTCIILTAESTSKLLSTIYSRVQQIEVLPVGEQAARAYFDDKKISAVDFLSSYALSQGQPGLLSALLNDNEHELKDWVKKAKILLGMPIAERLLQTDILAKDKINIGLMLNALQRIAHAALLNAGKGNKIENVKRFMGSTAAVQSAVRAYTQNANTKLLLDDLMLNL